MTPAARAGPARPRAARSWRPRRRADEGPLAATGPAAVAFARARAAAARVGAACPGVRRRRAAGRVADLGRRADEPAPRQGAGAVAADEPAARLGQLRPRAGPDLDLGGVGALGRLHVGTLIPAFLIGLGVALLFHRAFPGPPLAAQPDAAAVGGARRHRQHHLPLDARRIVRRRQLDPPAAGAAVDRPRVVRDAETAMFAVIVPTVWKGFPFFAITLLAALQAVPQTLYEAARVDGASAWSSSASSPGRASPAGAAGGDPECAVDVPRVRHHLRLDRRRSRRRDRDAGHPRLPRGVRQLPLRHRGGDGGADAGDGRGRGAAVDAPLKGELQYGRRRDAQARPEALAAVRARRGERRGGAVPDLVDVRHRCCRRRWCCRGAAALPPLDACRSPRTPRCSAAGRCSPGSMNSAIVAVGSTCDQPRDLDAGGLSLSRYRTGASAPRRDVLLSKMLPAG